MLVYFELFMAFLIPSILGYGGGPSSIPLFQIEIVNNYGWLTMDEFAELLALGNALPGPIATKIAGYVGYEVAGFWGAFISLFATIAPSLIAMVFLLSILHKHKDSPRIKKMTSLIRPTIAVLLALLAFEFFLRAHMSMGTLHSIFLIVSSYLLLEKIKLHPAFVILCSVIYGATILA